MKKNIVSVVCIFPVVLSCSLINPTGGDDTPYSRPPLVSTSFSDWFRASPPVSDDSVWYCPPAWKWYWFTPRNADDVHTVRENEIFVPSYAEQRAAEVEPNPYAMVLRLHVQPAPDVDSLKERFRNVWAGIQTRIDWLGLDMDSVTYLDFYCKVENGISGKGKLYLQLGRFSEDISLHGGPPNGKLDKEDTSSAIVARYYDLNLDYGIDRLRDTAEFYCIPGAIEGNWDTLRYGDPLFGIDSLDPSKDNFKYYYYNKGDIDNYPYAGGEQRNGLITGSEDKEIDGILQTREDESYFEVAVDLNDTLSPFIDTGVEIVQPGLWCKYRIPIPADGGNGDFTPVNGPEWSDIPALRLFWRDFPADQLSEELQLVLYGIRLVPGYEE